MLIVIIWFKRLIVVVFIVRFNLSNQSRCNRKARLIYYSHCSCWPNSHFLSTLTPGVYTNSFTCLNKWIFLEFSCFINNCCFFQLTWQACVSLKMQLLVWLNYSNLLIIVLRFGCFLLRTATSTFFKYIFLLNCCWLRTWFWRCSNHIWLFFIVAYC